MINNVGLVDRLARIILGAILIFVFFLVKHSIIKLLLLISGIVLILTALIGFCPIYKILGFSTCSLRKEG